MLSLLHHSTKLVKKTVNAVIDLIYPPLCLICGQRLLETEDQLCTSCLEGFKFINEAHGDFSISGETYVSKAWALFEYDENFQNLVHHLKYSRRRKPVLTVLEHYEKQVLKHLEGTRYDWVIPIPLHPVKQRERGYNQVAGMSRWLAEHLQTKTGLHLVQRTVYTKSQTRLNAVERQLNVKNVFQVLQTEAVKDSHILLVDDVLTTGATSNELARALTNSGALRVDLITLSTPG